MSEASPMPLPRVLHESRPHLDGTAKAADASQQVSLIRDAFEETRSYGELLWRQLEELRAYLLASLPLDPRLPGRHTASASPTGPDDVDGWQRWMAAYARTSSVLAGPQGDAGYGWRQARHEAEIRRNAPNIRLVAGHPELDPTAQLAPAHSASRQRSRPTGATILGIVLATLATQHLLGRRLRRGSQ